MTKPLSDFDLRALQLLASCTDLVKPGVFGSMLWPQTRRPPQAFARPAGKVLRRLETAGCAEWRSEREPRRNWGWRVTFDGRRRAGAKR